jgi:hypothetical protein
MPNPVAEIDNDWAQGDAECGSLEEGINRDALLTSAMPP